MTKIKISYKYKNILKILNTLFMINTTTGFYSVYITHELLLSLLLLEFNKLINISQTQPYIVQPYLRIISDTDIYLFITSTESLNLLLKNWKNNKWKDNLLMIITTKGEQI